MLFAVPEKLVVRGNIGSRFDDGLRCWSRGQLGDQGFTELPKDLLVGRIAGGPTCSQGCLFGQSLLVIACVLPGQKLPLSLDPNPGLDGAGRPHRIGRDLVTAVEHPSVARIGASATGLILYPWNVSLPRSVLPSPEDIDHIVDNGKI